MPQDADQPLGAHEFVRTLDRYKKLTQASLEKVQAAAAARVDVTLPLGKINVDLVDDDLFVTFDTKGDDRFQAVPDLHDLCWRLTRKGASHLLQELGLGLRHLDVQAGRLYAEEIEVEAGSEDGDEALKKPMRLDFLAQYLNDNFHHASLAQRPVLFRCLKGGTFGGLYHTGVIRAVRSTSYQRLDTHDIFSAIMPKLESGELGIVKAQFQQFGERLNLWLIDPEQAYPDPRTQKSRERDDRLRDDDGGLRHDDRGPAMRVPACRITLSETGDGSVTMTPGSILSVCTNGCVLADMQKRRAHRTGHRHEVGVPWREETVERQRVAALSEVTDYVDYAFSDEVVTKQRTGLERAAGIEITAEKATKIIRGKLEKADEIGKETVEQVSVLFNAMFGEAASHTLADASECLTQIRQFDDNVATATAIEETAGALLTAKV